jgi:hypothetical protein
VREKAMKNSNFVTHTLLIAVVTISITCALPLASGARGLGASQSIGGTIDPGTTIYVRTNEDIEAKDSDGRVYSGVVDQDVVGRNRRLVIPRGSDVELVVKKTSGDDVALDLDSVTINGQRYGIEAEQNVVSSERKEGIGTNKRTGKYVGGGALLGAIIGAVAGGGKGAAIGAGAGAAAGAGAQVLPRGKTVHVPAESLLTFRLSEPLRAGAIDDGYMRNGIHYHSLYTQDNYSGGLQKPGHYSDGRGTVYIGTDKNVSWQGPENATVYVQVDNQPPQLFASGPSGTQAAPWIDNGHVYTFVVRDASGNEIARDRLDLRSSRRGYRR